jgi:hypothetical protein
VAYREWEININFEFGTKADIAGPGSSCRALFSLSLSLCIFSLFSAKAVVAGKVEAEDEKAQHFLPSSSPAPAFSPFSRRRPRGPRGAKELDQVREGVREVISKGLELAQSAHRHPAHARRTPVAVRMVVETKKKKCAIYKC